MQWFVDHVLGAAPWAVYSLVGLVVFLEDAIFVGFVIPGETAAVLGGVSARLGHTHLWAIMLLVIVGAIVGDSVGYEVGKHAGPWVLSHRALRKHRDRLDRAQDFLRDKGGTAVFLGRWTAFFRAVMPALCGMSRMPYRRFIVWNALGGITWGSAVVTVGYLAGMSYERAATWFGRGTAAVVAVIVVVALVAWKIRRGRTKAEI